MLVLASDLFGRADTANGLGVADTGQVWQPLVGTMQVTAGRGRATSSSRSASVIDVVAGGGDATVDAACGAGSAQGGYALYARASDASNWWRLSVNAAMHQEASGGYWQSSQYVASWYCSSTTYDLNWNPVSSTSYYSAANDQSTTTGDGFHYFVTSCSPVYGTTSTWVPGSINVYTWSLTLEKFVAGNLTTAATATLNAAPTHLTVACTGDTLTGTCDLGQTVAATDSFNRTATRFGIGYGETTSYGNADGLDAFTVTVPVLPFVGWGVPM